MEQLFSVVALVGMGIAVVWGLRLMARAGQANARRANPLSPSDLKLLEETTQRLMSELRAVADECVARIDAACQAALAALPGSAAYTRWHIEAQRIFSQDLPVLPLYFVPKLVAARPGVAGVLLDPTEYLDLWNIEAFEMRAEAGQ